MFCLLCLDQGFYYLDRPVRRRSSTYYGMWRGCGPLPTTNIMACVCLPPILPSPSVFIYSCPHPICPPFTPQDWAPTPVLPFYLTFPYLPPPLHLRMGDLDPIIPLPFPLFIFKTPFLNIDIHLFPLPSFPLTDRHLGLEWTDPGPHAICSGLGSDGRKRHWVFDSGIFGSGGGRHSCHVSLLISHAKQTIPSNMPVSCSSLISLNHIFLIPLTINK